MRPLPTIVALQTLVLVVLSVLWSQRADAAPMQPVAEPAEDQARDDVAAADGASRSDRDTASTPGVEREAAPAPADASQGLVILQGRLLGLEPPPQSDDIRMWVTSGRWNRFPSLSPGGGYAIADLTPGPVTVHCEVRGCRQLEFEHQLDHRPIQRLDLTLEPAQVLKVFVRTPQGQRLTAELTDKGIWQRLMVVATRTPLPSDLAPIDLDTVGDFGIGRFRSDPDMNSLADPDLADGDLELDGDPPASAALLLRHVVLAQQPIAPGQRELHFAVPLSAVQALFAEVHLRVLGPDGAPQPKAAVSLSLARNASRLSTGDDGRLVIGQVLPGIATIDVWSSTAESLMYSLLIPSGGVLDLGDLQLTGKIELQGRCIDQNGAGVAAALMWTPIDLWRPPLPMNDNRSTSCDAEGGFRLPNVGRRRYVVEAHHPDGRIGFAVVDGATHGGDPLVISMRAPHTLQLDASAHLETRCVVLADPQGTPLTVCRIAERWRRLPVTLPSGDYQLIVYDGRGAELSRAPLQMRDADFEKVIP